jgi:CheY-like chemotaxis protein
MDYMMPEMDGLEACRLIVGNPATADIPVIMTTSNDTPEFRSRGVASGARGFLSKGLEDRELDSVLDIVRSRDQEREPAGTVDRPAAGLSEEALARVLDQAINASRQACEEYFAAQLPELETRAAQIAEATARRVIGEQTGDRDGAAAATARDIEGLRAEIRELGSEQGLRRTMARLVREETRSRSGTGRESRNDGRRRGRSGRGSRSRVGATLNVVLTVLILLVAGYFVMSVLFADSPAFAVMNSIVDHLGSLIATAIGP